MLRFKNLVLSLTLLIGLLSQFASSDFPTDPKPCAHGDEDCIIKIINYFAQKRYAGANDINLVPLDPLKISEIHIKQGAESAVNIDLVFTNNEILGLKTSTVNKVKGFGKDPTEKHEIHFKFKKLSVLGDYKISGKVLVLPIRGSGKSNITLIDTEVGLFFKGTSEEKNGENYLKVKDMHITYKPARVYYQFDNLFNGDKLLSDNMNAFLNENWRDIFNEVQGSLSTAFGKVFETVVNAVFTKYPYDKYFSE